MLDLSKVHQGGLKAIRESRDYFEESKAPLREYIDSDIASMSPREFLDAVLQWHGIIGYTQQIIDIYEAAKAAVVQDCICMGGTSKSTCNGRHLTGPCDCSGGPIPPEVRDGWEKYWARVQKEKE